MYHNEKNVITGVGVVIWDGVTRPETKTNNGATSIVHSLRIALPPGSPEIAELEHIVNKELAEGMWKGTLPNNGRKPLTVLGAEDLDGSLAGYTAFNATTYNGAPSVLDVNGRVLSAIEYGSQIYPGCKVRMLTHAYSYNNINKGIALGLDGIQIIDATTPRLAISGGVDAAAAFGAAPVAGTPATPPAPVAGTPATPPAPVAGAPATPAAPPAMPPSAPDFVNPPAAPAGPVMTAKANGVPWESFLAQGWTEERARQDGYIV